MAPGARLVLTSTSPWDESVRLADKGLVDPPGRSVRERISFNIDQGTGRSTGTGAKAARLTSTKGLVDSPFFGERARLDNAAVDGEAGHYLSFVEP